MQQNSGLDQVAKLVFGVFMGIAIVVGILIAPILSNR